MRVILFILFSWCFACSAQVIRANPFYVKANTASFSPSDISGLKLWVKADEISGLSDGDPVSTWNDNSGVSNTLTSSSTARPIYKTSILNSLPVVRFDGSNDVMSKSSPSGVTNISGMTIFLVVKQASLSTNQVYATVWDYATQGCWAFQTGDVNSDEMTLYIAENITSAGSNHASSTDANLTAGFYLIALVYDGSLTNANRVKIYKNGSATTTGPDGGSTIATTLTSATADLRLGQFGGSLTRNFNGDMAEVIIYNSALGSTDRGNVESYLRTKWNVY